MLQNILVWVLSGVLVVAVLVLLAVKFSPGARLRRRLKKARNPIVSKAPQPSVKFSVKTPKE